MYIKWKYADHGFGEAKELEIPDWAMKEYDSEDDCIKSYICEEGLVPFHGSRFSTNRIKWEKIEKTHAEMQEIIKKKIKGLKERIAGLHRDIEGLEGQLDKS